MTAETATLHSPEVFDEHVVEVPDYTTVKTRIDQELHDREAIEQRAEVATILGSIEHLGRQLTGRCSFEDRIMVGDTIYEQESFLTRTPDGRAPEEIITLQTITNLAGEKRPRQIADITVLLNSGIRKIRLDSQRATVRVSEQSVDGIVATLPSTEHGDVLLDLESRLLVAQYAADTRTPDEREKADSIARKLHDEYLSSQVA